MTVPRLDRRPLRQAMLAAQALALGGALVLGGGMATSAQDATPGAVTCVAPAASTTMGTEAMATPAAAADLAATPASDEIAARAAAAIDNFVACWNSGDLGAVLGLVTPNLLQTSFGIADAQAAEEALPELGLGAITLLETGEVSTYDDGRASIDVTYLVGDYQHNDARVFMVERDGQLLIDQQELLLPRPEGDQAIVGYTIADDATTPAFDQRSEIGPTPVLILSGVNNAAERRIVRLVRVESVAAATPVADAAAAPTVSAQQVAEGTTVGLISLESGEREDLALVGLPEGTYALVDDAAAESAAALIIAPQPEA